ncbi:hypothetical protein D3C85_815980 [compost metagenome]
MRSAFAATGVITILSILVFKIGSLAASNKVIAFNNSALVYVNSSDDGEPTVFFN